MQKHETVTMVLDGVECKIDRGVRQLISLMNEESSEIYTYACCQGDEGNDGNFGYVAFMGLDDNSTAAIDFMQKMLGWMNLEWTKMSSKTRRSMNFYFVISVGDGYIMRWSTDTYRYVLKSAKNVLDEKPKTLASVAGK